MSRPRIGTTKRVRSMVACGVGDSYYVLPVEQVQEIVQPLKLTRLPHAPLGVVGAVEHRQEVVPVLDLGARLGFGPTESVRRKWVLLRGEGRTIGVVVSAVHEVFAVSEGDLRPAPDVGDVIARAASHVVRYRDDMAFVLDLRAIAHLAEIALSKEAAS